MSTGSFFARIQRFERFVKFQVWAARICLQFIGVGLLLMAIIRGW